MWFCTETIKILHTQLNSNKKTTKITDINAFTLLLFSKNSRNLCVKFLAQKSGRVNLSTNIKSVSIFSVFPQMSMFAYEKSSHTVLIDLVHF